MFGAYQKIGQKEDLEKCRKELRPATQIRLDETPEYRGENVKTPETMFTHDSRFMRRSRL